MNNNETVTIPRLSDNVFDMAAPMFGLRTWEGYINKKLPSVFEEHSDYDDLDGGDVYYVEMSDQEIQAVCELIENYREAILKGE